VYTFLKAARIKPSGHNVCLYRNVSDGDVELEAGVQVPAAFESAGPIACSSTPAGRAARALHVGDYAKLGAAWDAVIAWCKERGLFRPGEVGWELYGDWSDDPAKLTTEVFILVP
jgi:effector-binding domain-containing protein